MLVFKNSTRSYAKAQSGGKGWNLYLMTNQGLPVPEWVIVGKRYFESFIAEHSEQLQNEIQKFIDGTVSAEALSKYVEELIVGTSTPKWLEELVAEAYGLLEQPAMISVRSSAADEDSASHSFAGQLSSYLYVTSQQDAVTFVKKCWASGFSERAISYRKENEIDLLGVKVSVVLQKMLIPEKSGVMFTVDPIEQKEDTVLVSAVYGVGEGIVSGALDADSYWLSKTSGNLINEELSDKIEKFSQGASGECITEAVPQELQNVSCLSAKELAELVRLAKNLEESYPLPQDAEWAIEKGKLYILQTRPITTLTKQLKGYPNLWDNSNIVESYGGLTLPLSFTFAVNNYTQVYIQFCEILGVSNSVIKDMEYYLRNMLGCIHGRVYYNLYNWYKLIGVLPGFKQNREFMETMMGVSEALTQEIEERISPHKSWYTPLGKLRKIRVGVNFLLYHFRIQGIVDSFLSDFKREYERFRKIDYHRLSSDQILLHFHDMERLMMKRWKAPIINDFLCMVHFGLLKKLTEKWLSSVDSNIQNDLLSGEGGLESAEPTKRLVAMAEFVHNDAKLNEFVSGYSAEDLHEAVARSEFVEFKSMVDEYIDLFGFRCMQEMKLEEKDLNTDPTYLYSCLKNYLNAGVVSLKEYEKNEKVLREKAEVNLAKSLKGVKGLVYGWVLKHARKAVKNRENTRFARTRAYGIARSQFQAMGESFVASGVIDQPDDVFWLRLEELYGIHYGTLADFNLKDTILNRKQEYLRFESEEPEIRFMTRGPVYWNSDYLEKDEEAELPADADYDMKGLPCCPGVIEGIVKVIQSPKDDLSLNGEILVTKSTDPGWVPLYPSISGLLVERGSLLSHSAIVAREMGLPAIVRIKNLTKKMKSGMRVRIDGQHGTITILEEG
ncbi:phosphoenolpyruvate synthase [bacterium]|nr:phosphoenolpyruvate synthase [bacterium]